MNKVRCPPAAERCTASAGLACPGNGCNGHGTCGADGVCSCFTGYSGSGCGDKDCPDDCSGSGTCNPSTGVCACSGGFVGDSCAGCAAGHEVKISAMGTRTCEAKAAACPSSSADFPCSNHGTSPQLMSMFVPKIKLAFNYSFVQYVYATAIFFQVCARDRFFKDSGPYFAF
jgi:hypothetical protein